MSSKERSKELKQQFKKDNKKNYAMSLVGKLLGTIMTISTSMIFTYTVESLEYKSTQKFMVAMLWVAICISANLLSGFVRKKYQNTYLRKALTQFKNYVFSKVLNQPFSTYTSGDTAKFISAFSNDLNTIEQHYLIGEISLFMRIIDFVVTAAVMLYLNLALGIITIVSSLIAIAVSFRFGGKVVKTETVAAEKASDFVMQTKDLLGGFPVIKSFRAEKEIMEVFQKKNVDLESAKQSRRSANDSVSIASNISATLVTVVFLASGFLFAFNGYISVGKVIGFFEMSGNLIAPIHFISTLVTNRKAANALIERIGNELDCPVKTDTEKEILDTLPTAITVRNLCYSYENGKKVLNGLNQTFDVGKSYAIVGTSGCGKSTLMKILMGFATGYSGEVCYADKELQSIDAEQLLDYVSTIQQEVFCFNSTIEENITMFREFPADELNTAIQKAGLSALYAQKGKDYLCGEGGCNLSGGERQRISIARCLMRKSPILFVDEAEAALDNETAHDVLGTILGLKNTLRVVITHRLDASVMKQFDSILVMHNGRIEEQGSFGELLEQKGYFYALYMTAQ